MRAFRTQTFAARCLAPKCRASTFMAILIALPGVLSKITQLCKAKEDFFEDSGFWA